MYDYNGQRIKRTENSDTEHYFYENGVVSVIEDNSGVTAANVLTNEGGIIGSFRGTSYHNYLTDVQGSTTNIIKEDGTLSAAYDYTDFGETTELTGNGFDNQVCYTGGIYDESTALYYLNARYYDPEIGRFISQDTYRGELDDPGQWHLYAYCANNPINYVDPSGHKPKRTQKVTRSEVVTYALRGKATITVKLKWKHYLARKKVLIYAKDVTYSRKNGLMRSSAFYTKQISSTGKYQSTISIKVALGIWKTFNFSNVHSGTKPWTMMTLEIFIRGHKSPWITTDKDKASYDTVRSWGWPMPLHPF